MSPLEKRPGSLRSIVAWGGLALGPLAALLVWFALPADDPSLRPEGRACAAIGTWMAVWWMTDALPLPVTALLPIVAFPLAGVFAAGSGRGSAIHQAAAPYGSEYIFLFLGGFLIALAVERWGLHRRIALLTVLLVGTRPSRLVAGFMLATAFLSLWISNTATTVLMLPIAQSVAALVAERLGESSDAGSNDAERFGTSLLLAVAYAASIGGVGTLIGTPPNVFLAAHLESEYGIELGFARWLAAGLPFVAVFLALAWLILTRLLFRVRFRDVPGGRQLIQSEIEKLGPLSRGELSVLVVFVLTATFWILREPLESWSTFRALVPGFARLGDPGIALIGGFLLFLIPVDVRRREFVLDWDTAVRLPWGVLLLFGGGLSLAAAVDESGLAGWISASVPADWPIAVLVVAVTALIVFLTELTSNLATATVFLPILGSIAVAAGEDPRVVILPAALAASCAFMLPVATPPNAIVYGSGRVTIGAMVHAGLWLNLVSIVLIPLFLWWVFAPIFGIGG